MASKKTKKTQKLDEQLGQPDPKAQVDSALLLRAAQPLLQALAADLLDRAKHSRALATTLRERHTAEQQQERTADPYDIWLRFFTKQVAAAWFLSCVFVRVLEDRGLVQQARIAGPGALDSQQLFFELAPSLSERDYLLTVFRELSTLPGATDLFDAKHNPVWLLAPSAELASQLLQLFRTPNANEPALRFGQADTRFLGDLYQDLDEDVRERFALLQTPHFIESFILDRTLEPAIERFGLDDTTLLDPTCGSGHFLLGAFERLFDHRLRAAPGLDVRAAAHKALDSVYGSDINPYAIAIARFRLTLAYLDKGGFRRLEDAPKLPMHLAVADSLLHNPQRKLAYQRHTANQKQVSFGEHRLEDRTAWERSSLYELEDPETVRDVLYREHAAVVGNPPYVTVKDKALREKYRGMYPQSAIREYSLAAPFTERFFQLGREHARVGMITANSFMKREFGKALIERFLPTIELDLVVNTSGAYIPGHGTPTVLLFGASSASTGADTLSVLAKRGEPSTPDDPAYGKVWSSIANHWSELSFDDDFITVAMSGRTVLSKHPWSLGGGGAAELKELLETRSKQRLGQIVDAIGFGVITGEDNVLALPKDVLERHAVSQEHQRRLVIGEEARDWTIGDGDWCVWSCNANGERLKENELHDVLRFLWPYRRALRARKVFGVPVEEKGIPWWALREVYKDRLRTPLTITFAFVATHNHFVLDRGGKVFNRSAPIIKLPERATEDDHLALLAYLNSSTACFWMKQVFYLKDRASGDKSAEKMIPEAGVYEFTGTGLQALPLPSFSVEMRQWLANAARELLRLAEQREQISAACVVSTIAQNAGFSPADLIARSESSRLEIADRMATLQEDIDWAVYAVFGLATGFEHSCCSYSQGLRPYLCPSDAGPEEWRERRQQLRSSSELRALEQPTYKRQWGGRRGVFGRNVKEFAQHVADASEIWLQQRVERHVVSTNLYSTGDWIRLLGQDPEALRVEMLLDAPLGAFVREKHRTWDAAPFLAAHCYTETGLEKRALWERTWALQRREDAGEQVGTVPVPPKYDVKDFRDPNYFRLRGKLDVPKERFISYPGCESDEDGEPLYGWAGWNHLQQAQALAGLYQARKQEGWNAGRLTPMLAGLLELLPWLTQWHNEPSAEFDGLKLGDYFEGYLDEQCAELGLTRDALRAWRPAAKTRGAGRGKAAATARKRAVPDEG